MRASQIIESAYRGTLEVQDDTIVWLIHAMRGIEADLSVLLCGNAVNYVLTDQIPPELKFGNWSQTQPTDIPGDIEKLLAKGVDVYVIKEDLKCRGQGDAQHIEGISLVSRNQLPALFENYEQVWNW